MNEHGDANIANSHLVNLIHGITQSQSGIRNQLWEEIPM